MYKTRGNQRKINRKKKATKKQPHTNVFWVCLFFGVCVFFCFCCYFFLAALLGFVFLFQFRFFKTGLDKFFLQNPQEFDLTLTFDSAPARP